MQNSQSVRNSAQSVRKSPHHSNVVGPLVRKSYFYSFSVHGALLLGLMGIIISNTSYISSISQAPQAPAKEQSNHVIATSSGGGSRRKRRRLKEVLSEPVFADEVDKNYCLLHFIYATVSKTMVRSFGHASECLLRKINMNVD